MYHFNTCWSVFSKQHVSIRIVPDHVERHPGEKTLRAKVWRPSRKKERRQNGTKTGAIRRIASVAELADEVDPGRHVE